MLIVIIMLVVIMMPLISIHMYYENDLLNLVKFPGCTQPPT